MLFEIVAEAHEGAFSVDEEVLAEITADTGEDALVIFAESRPFDEIEKLKSKWILRSQRNWNAIQKLFARPKQ